MWTQTVTSCSAVLPANRHLNKALGAYVLPLIVTMIASNELAYGTGDASFRAAGGEAGLRRLVDNFYDRMSSDARFQPIFAMHPDDTEVSRDKLARFLCGWLGGPKRYQEKYGSIGIPRVHAHLQIGAAERDQWLTCMSESIAEQDFAPDFKSYLMEQLAVPAEAVRRRCEQPRGT